jgi:hypothetical protein
VSMSLLSIVAATVCFALTAVVPTSSSTATSSSSDLHLPVMLTIDWQRLPDLSIFGSGFQNSDGGWVSDDSVVVTFGHGHGEPSPQNSFLKTAHLLNVTAATTAAQQCHGRGVSGCSHGPGSWDRLPDAPVSGRQDVASAVIDGSVYVLGGFSYTTPYSYADFLKLAPVPVPTTNQSGVGGSAQQQQQLAERWEWSRLPPFPYPVSMHATASIGSKFYVQGGACYNRKAFFNWADCTGGTAGLGKRLYVFDTAETPGSWKRLPDCPGPPKANAALSSVAGKLYLLGGMTFAPATGAEPPFCFVRKRRAFFLHENDRLPRKPRDKHEENPTK